MNRSQTETNVPSSCCCYRSQRPIARIDPDPDCFENRVIDPASADALGHRFAVCTANPREGEPGPAPRLVREHAGQGRSHIT